MPRAQTEATAYLELYKLVTEQQRLEQELASLEQRRDRILSRLKELNAQIATLDQTAHSLQDHVPAARSRPLASPGVDPFNTILLEY